MKQKSVMDKEIKCRDCGQMFSMSVGEIQWFENAGYDIPRRCKECRKRKKERSMGYQSVNTCAGIDF